MTSNKVLYSGLASFTELAHFHPIGVLHKWIMVGKNSNGFFFFFFNTNVMIIQILIVISR